MPRKPHLKSLLLPVLCALLGACGGGGEPGSPAERAVTVTTTVLQAQPWSDTVLALGTVKARESVTVTAKVSETVKAVHFDSGDEVAEGASLVDLTGNQQSAMLAQAEATANEAARLYKRQSDLAAQGVIAHASLDAQRAVRDSARARVAEMRASLGDRVIRAPFAGVLGLRQVSPGTLVTPGTPIATLDDIDRVYVDFPVPEAVFANLAVGQRLTASGAAYAGRVFEGRLSIVDSRIDPGTRSVNVRGEFANEDHALRPGMLLQVTLIRPERQALLVPEISIVQIGNSAYVYRVGADDIAQRADVRIGGRRDGKAEIVSGLALGERIVVDGTGKLRPGQKVAATPITASAGEAPAIQPAAG
jgi:membrane fusion protein (multidrug efflux system)